MKRFSLLALASIFFSAGILHFSRDTSFAQIVPAFFPYPLQIVWLTGIMEFIFALSLLIPNIRACTGLWLSLYCLAVLPANINMAINDIPIFGQHVSPLLLYARIVGQFGLIAWILYASDGYTAWKQQGIKGFFRSSP